MPDGREPAALTRALPSLLRTPTAPGGVELLPAENKVGADYDTEWARSYPARAARVLLVEGVIRPAIDLMATPTVKGLDRLADLGERPVVFAANHHSHFDTPLMLSVIPEPWRHHLFIGAAADYFFANRVTSTLSALAIGAIPIERTKVTRNSADQAAELIDDGWSMLIFPEGGRSPDGWGQTFRGGAAYLSIRCEVPVVPVHVEGTGRILRKGKSVPRPSPTTVTFGDPLVPGDGEDSRRMAARIERAVAELADEAGSDWWQARRRAAVGRARPRCRVRPPGHGVGPGPSATADPVDADPGAAGPRSDPSVLEPRSASARRVAVRVGPPPDASPTKHRRRSRGGRETLRSRPDGVLMTTRPTRHLPARRLERGHRLCGGAAALSPLQRPSHRPHRLPHGEHTRRHRTARSSPSVTPTSPAKRDGGPGNTSTLATSANDALGPKAYFDNPTQTAELIPRCHRSQSAEVNIRATANDDAATSMDTLNLACSGAETCDVHGLRRLLQAGHRLLRRRQGQHRAGPHAPTGRHRYRTSGSMVLSIGGNDFDVSGIATACVEDFLESIFTDSYCHTDPTQQAKVSQAAADDVQGRIVGAIANIRTAMANAGHTDADYTLVVQDYPQPLPNGSRFRYPETDERQSTGGCGFWNVDANWIVNDVLGVVNATVRAAVAEAAGDIVTLELSPRSWQGAASARQGVDQLQAGGITSWTDPDAVEPHRVGQRDLHRHRRQ